MGYYQTLHRKHEGYGIPGPSSPYLVIGVVTNELYPMIGLRRIPTPRSFASMPNSFFVSPKLVDPSESFCVGTARYITSISFLMLLEVRAKGRVSLKDNQSSLGVNTTFGTGQALRTCVVPAAAEIEIAASWMVAVFGGLLGIGIIS